VPHRQCAIEHRAVVDGDANAAASVVAKVTRDRCIAYSQLELG
jgi:ribonuclease HII